MRKTRDVQDDAAVVDDTAEVEMAEVDVTEVDGSPGDGDAERSGVEVDTAEVDVTVSEVAESDVAEVDVAESDVAEVDAEADPADDDRVAGDAAEGGSAVDGADVTEPVGAGVRTMIDPRGPRFGAALTVVVLAVVLLTIPSVIAVVLLVWQAIAFGAAALFGVQAQPYGILYRSSVAPRLGPPTEMEDAAPPRFAQQVGLVFVVVALVGLAVGVPIVAYIATAFALAAAFLNAAFNFCLGCEIYLLVQRFRRA